MHTRVCAALVLCTLVFFSPRPALSQAPATDPWYGRSPKARDFEAPKTPLGKFAIELPKDWQIGPGVGTVVFTAAERTKGNQPAAAAIVLQQTAVRGTIGSADINNVFAEVEKDAARQQQPNGESFEHQVKDVGGRRFIFIQYSKAGLAGADRVVQFSIPGGPVMYRLICVAPAAQIAKYQATFAHVAASFKIS